MNDETRTNVIDGLRQLADYLASHPDVPVGPLGWDVQVFKLDPDEAARRDEVGRIAAILGVQVTDNTAIGGRYTASRAFGEVTYEAICIPDRRRAVHQALMSYADAVTPDEPPEAA